MKARAWIFRGTVFVVGPALLVFFSTWLLEGRKFPAISIDDGYKRPNLSETFVYSDDAVYEAVARIRKRNCMQRYRNSTYCTLIAECDSEGNTQMRYGCERRLPGVLIIGAYKSGTRELIDFLAMNPQVSIKHLPDYETAYFDRNLGAGLEWYRDQMPLSVPSQVTIEKSPSYFASKVAPRAINDMNPDVKLILMVREPVARTLAHFSFDEVQAHNKFGGSLGRCVLQKQWLELSKPERKINKNCFSVKHSMYADNLQIYLEYFSLDQIDIIDSDEFLKDPCSVLNQVEKFLSIESHIQCHDFIFNTEKKVFCVVDISRTTDGVCYGHKRGRGEYSDTTESDQLEPLLKKFFKAHNKRFFEMIHKTFKW